jgi:chitinase
MLVAAAVVATAVAVVRARDGETDQATPSAPGARAHQLTGYWQNYAADTSANLRLRDVPAEYDVVAVAFAVADPKRAGAIRFAVDASLSEALGGYSNDDFTEDVKTLHADGRKVVLSVGGASDDVPIRSEADGQAFAETAAGLMSEFGFDGIDIDLEHGITVAALASGLRELVAAKPRALITMAPETVDLVPGGSYLKLIDDISDIITVVQTQFYNSGSMTGCDGESYEQGDIDFVTALTCTLLGHLRPDQISLGFPASKASAGSGYIPPKAIGEALDCLTALRHCGNFTPEEAAPALRGVMTWSVNNDASARYAFSKAVRAHLDTLPR